LWLPSGEGDLRWSIPLWGGVLGRFALCYTFVAFGIRASSSALTAPRCGGGADGVVSRGVQRRSHGKFPSAEGCRRSRRGGLARGAASEPRKIPLCGGVSAEPTGWSSKRVQKRDEPRVDARFQGPLLPRPPQGDLPPNTPTAPQLAARVPHRLAAPPNWRHAQGTRPKPADSNTATHSACAATSRVDDTRPPTGPDGHSLAPA